MKSLIFFILLFVLNFGNAFNNKLFATNNVDEAPALFSFSTGGYSIYHLKPATVNNSGLRVIISAAFNGAVLCHNRQGELLWKNETNKDFPFDLAVADIDNDGFDESFIATAGGYVYAYDNDGSLIWTFSNQAELYQVCPVKIATGEWRIYTGGIQKTVYILSSGGTHLSNYAAGDVVRHIRKGNILGDGKEYVGIATTNGGLSGTLSLILYDPNTSTQKWKKTGLGVSSANSGKRFFSMIVTDTDKDGKDDIILSTSWGDKGLLFGFNYLGNQLLSNTTSDNIPTASYRMNLLSDINFKGTDNDFIFGIFANDIIIYNANGSYNSIIESKYDFSNAAFDPETNTYYLGSSPSGGDGIYALNINHPDWKTAFQNIKPVGMLAQVEQNLATLTTQVNKFVKPSYQVSPRDIQLFTWQPTGVNYTNMKFGKTINPITQVKVAGELWCKNLDERYKYDQTVTQIIATVKAQEALKSNFLLWGGHGKAVYMSPAVLDSILKIAPVYFQGFYFAEMEDTDADMIRVVNEILQPLAQKCLAAKKKIVVMNKNIFWTGTCYMDFWKNVLLNPQYSEVFIPALEETNCRTQEISLAGRVGLWKTGKYANWGTRTVTDNACFDRMWEWSSQQVMSHYIREIVMRSSLGANYYFISFNQAKYAEYLNNQLIPLYRMLGKGVIAIPNRDEVLSVSDVCMGMKSPPDDTYLNAGSNGHDYNFSIPSPMVFNRLDAYWGAAPLLDYDFSKYGCGVERRMLNFLPKNPYGLVAFIPDNVNIKEFPWIKEKISTNGQLFYKESGVQQSAPGYQATVKAKLEEGASRLPVLVKGNVAWTVVKLDDEHVRITLIDPGYTDPANREAEIVLQHLNGTSATDILSGENINIVSQTINLTVPAGIFRIIDVKHDKVASVLNPKSKQLKIYPNPTTKEVFIQFNNQQEDVQLLVTDLLGKTIYSERLQPSNLQHINKFEINQRGIFFLKISGKDLNHTEKIICK